MLSLLRILFFIFSLVSYGSLSFSQANEVLAPKYFSQPVKHDPLKLSATDIAIGKKTARAKINDPHNLKIPDGFFIFMSTDLPNDYWFEMDESIEKFHAQYVMYGLSHDRFDKLKEISANYIKQGKVPKDKHDLYDLFPWKANVVQFKPEWFIELGVKEVPAFFMKNGNVSCMVKGAVSFKAAILEFVRRDCPIVNKWASKNNIKMDDIR